MIQQKEPKAGRQVPATSVLVLPPIGFCRPQEKEEWDSGRYRDNLTCYGLFISHSSLYDAPLSFPRQGPFSAQLVLREGNQCLRLGLLCSYSTQQPPARHSHTHLH